MSMKLVAGAGKSSEPHSLEAMVDFEMRKTHLNDGSEPRAPRIAPADTPARVAYQPTGQNLCAEVLEITHSIAR